MSTPDLVRETVISTEYPAGRWPPDPHGGQPKEGWFADGQFADRRWRVFVSLSKGLSGRQTIQTCEVDRKSITAWVKMWRRWWPGVLPAYGSGVANRSNTGNPDWTTDRLSVIDELSETAKALGAFESVPGRSLAAAAVESAAIFVEWAQGLTPEEVTEMTPGQAAQIGRVSAKLMESAFDLEDRMKDDAGRRRPAAGSQITNNLLINIESDETEDKSSAEKLGALLSAYQEHTK